MADDRDDRSAGGPVPGAPVGPVPARAGGERLLDLLRVMQQLRAPGGCPWDREQTHETLGRHLLEEAHETLEAIDSGDPDLLRDELGDVLLQVVFHAEMAREAGEFDADDVAEGIVRKLIRRHPHVFGDAAVDSSAEVLVNWEKIKSREKGFEHAVDDEIPATLPALSRAAKVQRRAAGFGFDWRTPQAAVANARERLSELEARVADGAAASSRIEDDLGDLLFAIAAAGRGLGVDPETSLRKATRRFSDRFERVRARAADDGVSLESLSDEELAGRFRAAGDGGPNRS
jgi:tetrapyrrole methylase family protein/MazG family protein